MTGLVIYIAASLIRLLQFLFFARAIMSWFIRGGSSPIYDFLYMVTEPIIQPFRNLTNRIDALRSFPMDVAFLLAFVMLEVLLTLLYAL